MHSFKAALFDLDGTLFDTEPQYSVFWKRMGDVFHPELKDFHKIIKGTTLTHILDTYFPDKNLQKDIVAQLDEYEDNMNYVFIDGAAEFVANIRQYGVKCAVVTSSNRKKIECVRKKAGVIDDLFDVILTSEDFDKSKPHPDCYLAAAENLNVKIEGCVVFEDAFNGIMAAKNASMFTVGLATTNPKENIEDLCNYVIDNFNGLDFNTIDKLLKHYS